MNTNVFGTVGGETYTFRISTICEDGLLVYQDVVENAVSAAFYDPRFLPLNQSEFSQIEIEINENFH